MARTMLIYTEYRPESNRTTAIDMWGNRTHVEGNSGQHTKAAMRLAHREGYTDIKIISRDYHKATFECLTKYDKPVNEVMAELMESE